MLTENETKNSLIYLPEHERYVEADILAAKIATYLFVETSHETSTGNWCTTSEEIAEFFGLENEEIVKELETAIVNKLQENYADMVESVSTYMDGDMLVFDVNLWHTAVYGFIEDDACFYVEEK